MPGKQKKIKEIIEQQNRELTADTAIYNLSQTRFNHRAAFLKNIEQKLTGVDAGNYKQLELVFQSLYQDIYINAELGNNLLISDKERVLSSIELCVFGNSNIHQKVWQRAKKLPIIRVMLNAEEYIRLGQELASIIKKMNEQNLRFEHGEWWRIKGRPFKIIGNIAHVNYILMDAERLEFQDAIFLSDLLPLELSDFEYLGEFPN